MKFENRQKSMATNTRMALLGVAESLLRHRLFCILIWIVVTQMLTEMGQKACPMGDARTVTGLGDPE